MKFAHEILFKYQSRQANEMIKRTTWQFCKYINAEMTEILSLLLFCRCQFSQFNFGYKTQHLVVKFSWMVQHALTPISLLLWSLFANGWTLNLDICKIWGGQLRWKDYTLKITKKRKRFKHRCRHQLKLFNNYLW